jgi:hypothetical protein
MEVKKTMSSDDVPDPPALNTTQRVEASLRDDQFTALAARIPPAERGLFADPDAVLKLAQTVAIVVALLWPVHDYVTYKREATELEIKKQRHEERLSSLAASAASSLQFTRELSTELSQLPGGKGGEAGFFHVRVAAHVSNRSTLGLWCSGVRLRLLLGALKQPGGNEYAARINSPSEPGNIAWRALWDSRCYSLQKVTDWDPKRVGIVVPAGGGFEEVQGGLAFGDLSPRESNFAYEDFKIRASRDLYIGYAFDYLLKPYEIVAQKDGKFVPKYGETAFQHVELVRRLAELGLQDEEGRTLSTVKATPAGAAIASSQRHTTTRTGRASRGALISEARRAPAAAGRARLPVA